MAQDLERPGELVDEQRRGLDLEGDALQLTPRPTTGVQDCVEGGRPVALPVASWIKA